MKADRKRLGEALDRPDPAIRFYLFHGDDGSTSRALADRLLKGCAAEKAPLAAAELRSDPARLVDEAQAIGLFGGARLLWIEPAGEECAAAVTALLDAPAAESATVAIAGKLRKGSALLKLAEGAKTALAHVSYEPSARDADQAILALAASVGLRIRPDVARRVAQATNADPLVARQELTKFALYLDATPGAPKDLGHDTVDAVGVDASEGEGSRAVDLALTGSTVALVAELDRLEAGSLEAISLLRALQRRLLLLAPLHARVQGGESVDSVLATQKRTLFWRDFDAIAPMLRLWNADKLAQLGERLAQLECNLMLQPIPTDASLGEEIVAIARAAARR
ncbi:DNA polymerase III subunit delta [Sphingomonas ginkgonis]|uniref:DNA-directed DNA polymerase n=1 Tax=Sphingomonas ginkgonis TaxID=2315330 RepID=A0A429V765_9SPHN|nr:DNA polymerase III subunit delta [Sphingomonas ginkgonis]RST29749.1 DNA polymerase III subunit delta [Sphingomonas ginkgonis]